MNRPRLESLITLLEAPLPPRTCFDIDLYIHHNDCGTVCCAAGLAALTPAFQAQGFKEGVFSITFEGESGLGAIKKFFDLTDKQAHSIFFRSSYTKVPARPDVVKRIRRVLANEEIFL